MKKLFLPLALALCLLLAACGNDHTEANNDNQDSTANDQTEISQPDNTAEPDGDEDPDQEGPVALGTLTVEVVVDWDSADALLSRLEELSVLLDRELAECGYDAEAITVTVSTAGGTTADALAAGGVDVALLPAEDFAAREDSAVGILMSDEEVPAAVVAVTKAKPELDEAFQAALCRALTAGEDGSSFLAICCPAVSYTAYDGQALQPVRDQLAEEETHSAAGE